MILVWIVLLPLLAGVIAGVLGRTNPRAARWVCVAALALNLALALGLWLRPPGEPGDEWMASLQWSWIPQFGVSFHLGLDGLSLLMILLTAFLGLMAVGCSWTEITEKVGFFHFNLMWVLSGIFGIFVALDLFLFYFFWELMLIPMYFLILIWGHENRRYAAIKFFLFTQAGGLLMLLAILALYFAHGAATGVYTYDYTILAQTPLGGRLGFLVMLGFFIAFAVKIPAFPVHTWLPDAHTEAPTAGSVVLAGLLLKTGAYGVLRFVLPMFPEAVAAFAQTAFWLGVIGIIYGAVLAFAQTDLKRLVAYTSVSHMGFVVLGAFAGNELALQGVVMQMICHGISTGALFMIVGMMYERIHTRDMDRMGGMWEQAPRMAGVAMLFAMASLGLPGLGNFIAEFLTLVGLFDASRWAAVLATLGLVFAAIYSLWIMQRVFHGRPAERWTLRDMVGREKALMAAMIAVILWLGLYPQPVIRAAQAPLARIQAGVAQVEAAQAEEAKHDTPLLLAAESDATEGVAP